MEEVDEEARVILIRVDGLGTTGEEMEEAGEEMEGATEVAVIVEAEMVEEMEEETETYSAPIITQTPSEGPKTIVKARWKTSKLTIPDN